MRVTGGQWAGRRLVIPKGPRIRPTRDQVRQALFNLLGERVIGARALDLFSGSGALGLEALSRGAAHVTFVERSGYCVEAIAANLKSLLGSDPRGENPFELLRGEALKAILKLARQGRVFDLILLDPPYGPDLARKTLIALARRAILAGEGWVVVEHDKRDPLPPDVGEGGGALTLQRAVEYGDTAVTLYRRQ
jgi:16S rRNA (guanine966-N2)-methyltransferase